MTHKGGKKAKAAFNKAKSVPRGIKEKVEDLSVSQLAALLRFIEVLLKSSQVRSSKRRSKSSKRKGKRRMTPAQKKGLIKAIHKNPKMSPTAKRKALASLRSR